jgi:hypothetical protein
MLWTRISAALMAVTFLIHVIAGGKGVHAPLQAALTDPGLAAFAALLWHAVTVVLAVSAVGIWVLANRQDPALEAILSAIQLGLAALFIFYGLTRLGTLFLMPQWIIFLAIPLLTRFGQSRERPS